MAPQIGQVPNDREQIITFLLARGDERDKTIHELQEANAVLGQQVGELQKKIAALTPDTTDAPGGAQQAPPNAEKTA